MRSIVSMLALFQGGTLNIFPIYFFWWLIGGECGTPYPGWWPFPFPRPEPPDPDPGPPVWTVKLIGAVAGVAGGWAFTKVFGPSQESWFGPVSILGAFAAGRVVGDVFLMAKRRR